jgi:hypothetical protein
MSFLGVLGLIFIVLKLVGVIAWSWWLVLLPFYGGLVLLALIFVVAALAAFKAVTR